MLYHCTKCQFTTLAADFLCCGPIEQGEGFNPEGWDHVDTSIEDDLSPNELDWTDDDQLEEYWYGPLRGNIIREFRNSGI